MANSSSLNRPFYCAHCGDNLNGVYDYGAAAFILVCPRTGQQQQTVPAAQVPTLRLEERERLAALCPGERYLIPVAH